MKKNRNAFLRIIVVTMAGLLLWALPAPAAVITGQALSLDQALELALTQNPGLEAAGYQAEAAAHRTAQARAGYLPQVRLQGRASQTTNPMWAFGTKLNQQAITNEDFNPNRLNDPDAITNYNGQVAVTLPLYDQGRTWYGVAQADLAQEAERLGALRIRQEVATDTITAYFRVLLARARVQVLVQSIETAKAHLKLVESRYNGGFVAKSDLLRTQVRLAELTQSLADARSQEAVALALLCAAMGEDPVSDLSLTTPLAPGQPVDGTPETWTRKALDSRPDLNQLSLQVQITEKEAAKARAARHPWVGLEGNYEVNTEGFSDSGSNYTVGATVQVPLYTGGLISAGILEAKARLAGTRARLKAMTQQVGVQVRQAFFDTQSTWERIQVAKEAVAQSTEALRIVKDRYQSGLFSVTDLLDAQTAKEHSLTRELEAIHDFRTARARLDLAVGRPAYP